MQLTRLIQTSFFPNGLGFSTGSDDCKAILWDIRALAELTSFADDSIHNGITSLAHSISGHYLFAAYDDNSVRVWDTLTATSLHQFNVHHGKVSCIGVSADGAALCTGSWDYNLKVRRFLLKKKKKSPTLIFL